MFHRLVIDYTSETLRILLGDFSWNNIELFIYLANSSHTYRRDLKEAIYSKYSNSQSNNLTRCLTNIDTNIVSKTNNKPISPGLTGFSFRQTEKVIKMQSSRYREWGYEASEIYSSNDQLSEKELSIYRSAGNFVPGTIPLSSPSENLCTFS